jgi:hypothetical protein
MSRSAVVILVLSGIGFMFAQHMIKGGAELPMENGESSATTLPADRAASEVAFQTATFGLG